MTPVLLLLALGQVPGMAEFRLDFRSFDPNDPQVRVTGQGLTRDELGVRVKIPAAQGKVLPTTSVAANFSIHGDFEVTAAFEVLSADKPDKGYGVGVSIFAALDPKLDAASLARRLTSDNRVEYVANRFKIADGKRRDQLGYLKATASACRLRMQRVGSMMRYFVADGLQAEFVQMHEADFGLGDVRPVLVGADAGGSEAGLDARLLSFEVRADSFLETAQLVQERPIHEGTPPFRRGYVFLAIVAGLALLLTGAWRLSRKGDTTRRHGDSRTRKA